jgi:hypothetical protein
MDAAAGLRVDLLSEEREEEALPAQTREGETGWEGEGRGLHFHQQYRLIAQFFFSGSENDPKIPCTIKTKSDPVSDPHWISM